MTGVRPKSNKQSCEALASGYPVKIITPLIVKPFIKSNKNDANDAHEKMWSVPCYYHPVTRIICS
jgi:transposase